MNRLLSLLPIQYPIVQAPMLGVTTPEMVAAISNNGGLGSLPVGGLSPEDTRALIRKTKSLTTAPWQINLFAHAIPAAIDTAALEQMQDYLEQYAADRQLPFTRRTAAEFRFYSYREQLPVLIEEGMSIVSFTFGVPAPDVIATLKSHNITLIGTATSVAEAQTLADAGMDIIVAQGYEAGGHRGSFLGDTLPQVGLFSLLPQVVDAVHVPVLAAGGIFDARTVRAAFQLGAVGVQIGTLFVPSAESAVSEAHRDTVVAARDTDTTLTRAFSGRWARGVRNEFMRTLEASGVPIPDYTLHNSLTAGIRAYGRQHNNPEVVSLWAGQSAGKTRKGSTADIFNSLIRSIDLNDTLFQQS